MRKPVGCLLLSDDEGAIENRASIWQFAAVYQRYPRSYEDRGMQTDLDGVSFFDTPFPGDNAVANASDLTDNGFSVTHTPPPEGHYSVGRLDPEEHAQWIAGDQKYTQILKDLVWKEKH